MLFITVSKAQKKLAEYSKVRRLSQGLTQKGLADRAGVHLPTLRRFEQKGLISLESFLKLLMVLNGLEDVVEVLRPKAEAFTSIDDVLNGEKKKRPKRGWRT